MPEKTILYCDAPGCDEEGDYETLTVDGKTYQVILGPTHKQLLREIAGWGRPAKPGRAARTERRDTSPQRLMRLLADD